MNDPQLAMTFFYLLAILGFGYFCVAQGILGRLDGVKRLSVRVARDRQAVRAPQSIQRASR